MSRWWTFISRHNLHFRGLTFQVTTVLALNVIFTTTDNLPILNPGLIWKAKTQHLDAKSAWLYWTYSHWCIWYYQVISSYVIFWVIFSLINAILSPRWRPNAICLHIYRYSLTDYAIYGCMFISAHYFIYRYTLCSHCTFSIFQNNGVCHE